MIFDWDAATVTVTVPVHHTATTDQQDVKLTLRQFVGLLLSRAPAVTAPVELALSANAIKAMHISTEIRERNKRAAEGDTGPTEQPEDKRGGPETPTTPVLSPRAEGSS